MNKPPLTKGEDRVYTYILGFLADNGYAPSYKTIAEALGMTSNGATLHVKNIEQKGWIEFGPVEPGFRKIKVIHKQ